MYSLTVVITIRSCINKIPRTNEKDAKLNRQFLFGNDLKKTQSNLRMRRQKSMKYIFQDIHK